MLCPGGGDAIVSGVDEPVCSVSSVMTAGELVVCGCGSLVSDKTGDVVSLDDVVARVAMTHCCLMRFALVDGCRCSVSPWCVTLE